MDCSPNHTGVGHQPLYFDQLMTIYNHYIVIGAKITVKFYSVPCYYSSQCMPLPNDDGTIVPASFTALAEQGAAVSGVVSASGDALSF